MPLSASAASEPESPRGRTLRASFLWFRSFLTGAKSHHFSERGQNRPSRSCQDTLWHGGHGNTASFENQRHVVIFSTCLWFSSGASDAHILRRGSRRHAKIRDSTPFITRIMMHIGFHIDQRGVNAAGEYVPKPGLKAVLRSWCLFRLFLFCHCMPCFP